MAIQPGAARQIRRIGECARAACRDEAFACGL
jgi:hypothetical protein